MQPCKLYFSVNWESEIWRGRQRGGAEKTRQGKKKGKVGKTPAGEEKKCGGRGEDQLPPPRIRQCPAMCSQLSLCAGVEPQRE